MSDYRSTDVLGAAESFEIRLVENGFVVTVHYEEEEKDYVFDSHQKTLRFMKPLLIQAQK